jgi:hypothetical protein
MTIQRLLIAAAMPLLFGILGFAALSRADAANQTEADGTAITQNAAPFSPDGQRPQRPQIDFAAAAATLNVSEAELREALGVPENAPTDAQGRPPRPDIQGAAAELGVTEQQLVEALGLPLRRGCGEPPAGESATNES